MIAARFEPGSGWYRPEGASVLYSDADMAVRRRQAWRCFALPIRKYGLRISGERLLHAEPIEGGILMERSYDDRWHAGLLAWPGMRTELLLLANARVVKEVDGCRQYQGLERDAKGIPSVAQTWLCAPTQGQLMAIVARMASMDWR